METKSLLRDEKYFDWLLAELLSCLTLYLRTEKVKEKSQKNRLASFKGIHGNQKKLTTEKNE